jgi:hypothetical protein
MFDRGESGIELLAGEALAAEAEDQLAYEVTCRELADGRVTDRRDVLPDLESIPPGPFLAVLLETFDRSKLNGNDVVRVLRARERQIAHSQAGSMADMVEMSYSAPGDADSEPERLQEQFEFAADELRPALTLSRRSAEFRMSDATEIRERLPEAWQLMDAGLIDVSKARAFCAGTGHLPIDTARSIVAQLADVAPRLTVGQLKARIRRLCITADPEDARKREKTAREERRLVIEPTAEGTADLHLYGLAVGDARAIGRRVNGYMISLKKEDRSGRGHDQLRADIARDFLLGDISADGGKGLVDIHVSASTLDGGSDPGLVGGLGAVTAETARHIVESQPGADHQITLTDEGGNPTHIYTLSRRATKKIRKHMAALQPTCSFPGCLAPADDCDFDHLLGWKEHGETSTTNGGPKCDHDHQLKDHGWTHDRADQHDTWTSPLGHTYNAERAPPI